MDKCTFGPLPGGKWSLHTGVCALPWNRWWEGNLWVKWKCNHPKQEKVHKKPKEPNGWEPPSKSAARLMFLDWRSVFPLSGAVENSPPQRFSYVFRVEISMGPQRTPPGVCHSHAWLTASCTDSPLSPRLPVLPTTSGSNFGKGKKKKN